MKIYDISQEVFSCRIYPGDPAPERVTISSMSAGACYNLTGFSMCAHNGTHIDAPYHFFNDGKTVEQIALENVIGRTFVVEHDGVVSADDARAMLDRARAEDPDATMRILIKGNAVVSLEAAEVFAESKILLIGNESQTVGPEDAPMAVHKILLGADVVLLEGICLGDVPEGVYLLNAAPISLAGADGAPCRAILIKDDI